MHPEMAFGVWLASAGKLLIQLLICINLARFSYTKVLHKSFHSVVKTINLLIMP